MRVAYLVNQYPKTSHSFIRREIAGVEASGVEVVRFSIRRVAEPLIEPADIAEAKKTCVLLDSGVRTILFELALACVLSPFTLASALRTAFSLARSSHRGYLYHIAYLAEACRLRRLTHAARVDHVHAHFGTNATAVATLCRALGGPPFSFTVHSPGSSEVPELCALTTKMSQAEFVCAVSQHGKSQLLRWSSAATWNRIHLVHCGTDQSFRGATGCSTPSSPRLVCVARMSSEKGHGILLQAAAQLASQSIEFELALVGDGPLRSTLEIQARELGIADRVHFLGWKTGAEVRAEILASRVLVLPSFVEGLPVVAMEAFALNRPVIATWVGGVPELVEANRSGWLVPAGSVDDLANACRAALEAAPTDLDAMGSHGAARVAEQHDAFGESARLAGLFRNHLPSEAA